MPSLPTPGSDSGTWGDELNEYLQVAHADDGSAKLLAHQFRPEDYGALRDGRYLYDLAISSSGTALTTAGLPAPATPSPGHSGSGGSVLAGAYGVKVTWVNEFGETVASAAGSTTTTGSASIVTVTSPGSYANAIGWYAYITAANGSTYFRQQTAGHPTPCSQNFTLSAPPSTSGATAPSSDTSASAPFTSGDSGKYVCVSFGGSLTSIATLCTHVTGFTSSSHVTVANASSRNVSGAAGLIGTDDTQAFLDCRDAMIEYALAHPENPDVEMVLTNGIYCVAGAPQNVPLPDGFTDGEVGGNAIIPLTVIDPGSGPKVGFSITAPVHSGGPQHWTQPNPDVHGAVIACMRSDGTWDDTNGPASVIGGPTENVGGGNGFFSNMRVSVDGLTLLIPYPPTYAGLDLFDMGQANIGSLDYKCMAVSGVTGLSANGTAAWPQYVASPLVGTDLSWEVFGYRSPALGNNAQSDLDRLNCYGPAYGAVITDHFDGGSMKVIFTFAALIPQAGAAGAAHHCHIDMLCSEANKYPVYLPTTGKFGTSNGSIALTIDALSMEGADTIIHDAGNQLYGEAHAEMLGLQPPFAGVNGAGNFRLVWDYAPLGPVSAWTTNPDVPDTDTDYKNTFWSSVGAVVVVTGGTVTGIAIDGVDTGLTAGPIFVRSGGTITLTYSDAPTWQWILL